MSIAQEALGIGKSDFSKKLSQIINNHRAGSKLIGKPRDFVIQACRLSTKFSEVANRKDVEIRLENLSVGPRKVKMLTMRQNGKRYPVPKKQLVDNLYPPKQSARAASPEKKHALAVRATMRQLIDSQLRDYRSSLDYPLECYVTGKLIRPGMSFHIDHILKPFVQICDEFISECDLTYCEIKLCGPPNLKRFANKDLQTYWQYFHCEYARLAPTLAQANMSKGSGTYEASEALIGTFEGDAKDDVSLDF